MSETEVGTREGRRERERDHPVSLLPVADALSLLYHVQDQHGGR